MGTPTSAELALQAEVRQLRGWIAQLENERQSSLRHAEEQNRNERERLKITLNCIGDAVLATDAAGIITLLNPAAARLTGWTEEEALGRTAREFTLRKEWTSRWHDRMPFWQAPEAPQPPEVWASKLRASRYNPREMGLLHISILIARGV